MDASLKQLAYALETYPEKIEAAPVEQILVDSARQNAKRPAYVKLAVPDDLVKQLRGQREQQDLVLLLRVPREVLDRAESRIILPGEATPAGG